MKILLALKIILLVIALTVFVAIMRGVTPSHMQRFFAAFESGQTQNFNLCRTRVHAMIWTDGHKIEESKNGMKMKWLAYTPAAREVSYLEVERWLGENCRVPMNSVAPETAAGLTFLPFMTFQFIDQQAAAIMRAGDVFQVDGAIFKSAKLANALDELKGIATAE